MFLGGTTGAVFIYLAAWVVVAGLLAVMCMVDVRTRRIPNKLVVGVCAAWLVMQGCGTLLRALTGTAIVEAAQACGVPSFVMPLFALPSVITGVVTAAATMLLLTAIGALYERLFRKQAMGFGDVKLIGAFALFLGPIPTIVCVMLACTFALFAALPARLRTFPFAPALVVAFVCVMIVEL